MNCDYTDPGGAPLERIAQQQAGTHPAPCARSCEANAYQIELRRYQAEVEQFRADARRFRLAEKNLFDVQEAAKTIAKQAIAAEAERDAMAAKLKDAEHDRDEFRRVMNGFAEKLAELEGQEPVAWLYDWQAPEGLIKDWVETNRDEIQEGATSIRPLFARQVPAEPVNVRLLEALTKCRNRFAFYVEHHRAKGDSVRADGNAQFVAIADEAIARAEAALAEPQPDTGLIGVQWWLAELDRYGNATLVDGKYSDRSGADQAMYIFKALNLDSAMRYAVARVELSELMPRGEGVNHEAIKTLNDARRETQP